MADSDEQQHLSGQQARAGETPHMTRYILGISLVLVTIVFAILLLR